MRRGRARFIVAGALLMVTPAFATEDCVTTTPQPNVRRTLEKQAGRMFAPQEVNKDSLWFCAYGRVDAEAVVESMPERLADGSDRVRRAWCQRYDAEHPTRWKCQPNDYRKTEVTVTVGGTPSRFTVVLAPEAGPDLARRVIEQALAVASQVTAQNRCGIPASDRDRATFDSDFATPPTPDNSTFTLAEAKGVWQVNRRASSVTFAMSEIDAPRLTCWAAASEVL